MPTGSRNKKDDAKPSTAKLTAAATVIAALITAAATLLVPMINHAPPAPAIINNNNPNITVSPQITQSNQPTASSSITPVMAPPPPPAPPPRPVPNQADPTAALGPDTQCQAFSQSDHADAILAAIPAERLARAPIARIAGSAQPVRLRDAPGEQQTGTLPTNTRVRVVCRLPDAFAVIKQENGALNGVIDRNALLATD